MSTTEGAPSPIEIIEVEPRLIAMVRKTVALTDMRQAQVEARILLEAALEAAEIEADGRALTVWRPPHAGMMDYAPGIFVPEGFGVSGAVSLFTLPPGQAAHLRMNGPYTGLPDAWRRLFAGTEERGLALAGLNWEVYASAENGGADLYALVA